MAKHRIVHLVHNQADGTIDAKEPIEVKEGDTIEFTSDHGTVNVRFTPAELFSASHFTTGADRIRVLKSGKARICWGLVVDGVVIGYPENERFGHNVET